LVINCSVYYILFNLKLRHYYYYYYYYYTHFTASFFQDNLGKRYQKG